MRNRANFSGNNENEVEASEAKNCLSSKNVNLCLLDSLESIAQVIKLLQKTTGGSKVNPTSFGS